MGRALTLLRPTSEAQAYVSWRVRRYLHGAASHPWIICDPKAAWFLRHTDRRPPAVVAHLADPGTHLASVEAADRPALLDADLWFTVTDGQAAEVRGAGVTVPVHPIGTLWESHRNTPLPPSSGARDPVVISTPSGTWEAVSHTVEVIAQLRRRVPGVPVVWLTDPGEDEWLARHDFAHLNLPAGEQVTVRRRDNTSPLRPKLIVRTGYVASDPDLVLAAAFAQIPTIGFDVGDLPPLGMIAIAPFAVEDLVDRTIELLDEQARQRCGAALADAVRNRLDPHGRLKPLYDLLGPA